MLKSNKQYLSEVYSKIKLEEKVREKIKKLKWKPVFTVFLGAIVACIVSLTVYAGLGGTINGKPVLEWMGITFSDKYEEYFVPSQEACLESEGAKLELVGSVCDEGFVVLQFNLYLEESAISKLKEVRNGNTNANLEKLDFNLSFNAESDELPNNFKIMIDGEEKWIRPRSTQKIEKTAENQYKIYQMHFLTEQELGNKTEFTLTIAKTILKNWDTGSYIVFDKELNIPLSKDPVRNNTKTIEQEIQETSYKKMTTKLEKVSVSPIQTSVKLTSIVQDVSLGSLESIKHPDYIPFKEYQIRKENGEIIPSIKYETKREIHYRDGKIEQWEQGDIGTSQNFYGATMILTEYIAFETIEDLEEVMIVPYLSTIEEKNGTWQTIKSFDFSKNFKVRLKSSPIEDIGAIIQTNNTINDILLEDNISNEIENENINDPKNEIENRD